MKIELRFFAALTAPIAANVVPVVLEVESEEAFYLYVFNEDEAGGLWCEDSPEAG